MIQIVNRELNINYQGPAPSDISDPAVRASLEVFVEAFDRNIRYGREVVIAERALLDAASADELRTAELNEKGEDDPDPLKLQTLAEAELRKAEARRQPSRLVLSQSYSRFRETIAGNRSAWQKAERKVASAAVDKLALALRQLQQQYAALESSLGVLELLHDESLPYGHVRADWTFGRPELSGAVNGLDKALDIIVNQVRSL